MDTIKYLSSFQIGYRPKLIKFHFQKQFLFKNRKLALNYKNKNSRTKTSIASKIPKKWIFSMIYKNSNKRKINLAAFIDN